MNHAADIRIESEGRVPHKEAFRFPDIPLVDERVQLGAVPLPPLPAP